VEEGGEGKCPGRGKLRACICVRVGEYGVTFFLERVGDSNLPRCMPISRLPFDAAASSSLYEIGTKSFAQDWSGHLLRANGLRMQC